MSHSDSTPDQYVSSQGSSETETASIASSVISPTRSLDDPPVPEQKPAEPRDQSQKPTFKSNFSIQAVDRGSPQIPPAISAGEAKLRNVAHFHNLSPSSSGNTEKPSTQHSVPLPTPAMAKVSSFNNRPLTDTPITSSAPSPSMEPSDMLGDRSAPHYSPLGVQALLDAARNSETASTASTASAASNSSQAIVDSDDDTETALPTTAQAVLGSTKRRATTLDVPGLTRSKTSPDGAISQNDVGSKLVIVMVGLPARGKSYITNKLCRYLNWLQHECKIFNVGNTRRSSKKNLGPANTPIAFQAESSSQNDGNDGNSGNDGVKPAASATPASNTHRASFFSPNNPESRTLREQWAKETLDLLLDYVLEGSGSVGIFDATNTTRNRRRWVYEHIQKRSHGQLKVLFLETICENKAILEENIRLKLQGPDYRNLDPELALRDFRGRLENYEKVYETIGEEEERIEGFQYVKMIDVGKKVVAYNIQGFLAGQTVFFLFNFNLAERQIWVTRHGESTDNVLGRIGGDAPLTEHGKKFARALARFVDHERHEFRKRQLENFASRMRILRNGNGNNATPVSEPQEPNFCIWTSMLERSVATAECFDEDKYFIKEMRMLNELSAGSYEGMTYEEIQEQHPEEFMARMNNKIAYRYPGVGGESYLDVINRLRPVIVEIERTTDHVMLITHRVVARIVLSYFMNLSRAAIGELDVPLHAVYVLEPKPYGVDWTIYEYNEKDDWFYKVDPDKMENSKKVPMVETSYRERQYSIIPTAPPNASLVKKAAAAAGARPGTREHVVMRRAEPSLPVPQRAPPGAVPSNSIHSIRDAAEGIDKMKLRV